MVKERKAVTMKDIAQRLQVSTVTVSKALSGQKGVSETLREKIRSLAMEMGYLTLVKDSKENQNISVSVLIASRYLGNYETFYFKLYQELSQWGMNQGCFTLLEGLSETMLREQILPKSLEERKAQGVIVVGNPGYGYEEFLLRELSVPVVFVDFYDKQARADCFISDGFYGTYLLTDYLIRKGHQNIAYVGTLFATQSITDRYLGYVKAMMEQGLPVSREEVIEDRDLETGLSDGYLDYRFPKQMPTAFVCNCDFIAGTVINALRNKGYRVPEDVSVVGYDNYQNPAFCNLGITTFEVDIKTMAANAVETLFEKMEGREGKPGIHIIKGRLIEKESVRAV